MASIYDIANIQAGDPQARAGLRADRALSGLKSHQRDRDIIEEINAAYAEAERKAGHKKGTYGLGASILGGLLGLGLGPIGQIIASAGLSGLAEKRRQDVHDPTKELREVADKYGDTEFGQGLDENIEMLEDHLDSSIVSDAFTSGMTSAVLGGGSFAGDNVAGLGGDYAQIGVDEGILGGAFPQFSEALKGSWGEHLSNFADKPLGQALLWGAKLGGPSLMQDLIGNDYYGQRMAPSSFRNPYGGY